MTDPSNVPAPPTPTPNGDPIQHHSGTPEYWSPHRGACGAGSWSFRRPGVSGAAATLRPAIYGQPNYGQQEYGQSYGQSAPNANPYAQPSPAYGQVPPTYNQYAAPTGAVPLNKPYYGCPFSEAFLRFWQKYTVFRGRASRSEFWWWTLAAVIINALLSLLGDVTDGRLDFLTSLWNLAIVVPGLALAVRRLHDTNKPGWWVAVFCGMMTLGLLIMIVGGGAALYGAIGAIGHNYDYGYGYGYEALATGGFGALAIGGLIMLASAVTGIVFMALPSKPEGARFDDDAAIGAAPQKNAYGMPYGASAAPGFPLPAPPPKTSARPSPRMGRTHNTGRLHNTHRPRNTAKCRPNTRNAGPDSGETAEATCINGEAPLETNGASPSSSAACRAAVHHHTSSVSTDNVWESVCDSPGANVTPRSRHAAASTATKPRHSPGLAQRIWSPSLPGFHTTVCGEPDLTICTTRPRTASRNCTDESE